MSYENLSPDQLSYIQRLALRLVRYRKSASIDSEDLVAAATLRWWQYSIRHLQEVIPGEIDTMFRQQIKFAMRDVIRESAPVKVTRAHQAKLQAYEQPYTVDIDHLIDVHAGDEDVDVAQWLDVMSGLKTLSQKEQTILSLAVDHGYSFTEIAYVMDVSVSTITRSYHGSLEKLKKYLTAPQEARKK